MYKQSITQHTLRTLPGVCLNGVGPLTPSLFKMLEAHCQAPVYAPVVWSRTLTVSNGKPEPMFALPDRAPAINDDESVAVCPGSWLIEPALLKRECLEACTLQTCANLIIRPTELHAALNLSTFLISITIICI